MSKGKDFCHLPEISGKYRKKILDTLTKVGLDDVKAASRKVGHKTAGAIGELMGKKIADEIMKRKPVLDVNSWNVEGIVVLSEKRQKILKKFSGGVVEGLSLLHNFIQQSLNAGSVQVQILLAACQRFEMVRISDNDSSWK